MNDETWVRDIFRPLAVGGMMGSLALSVVNLARIFFPGWNGTFIVVGCVLAALEANYSYRLIRIRNLRGSDVLRFRASEVALFLVLLRIGSYVGLGWGQVLADLRAWPQEPWRLVDLELIYAFLLVLLSWMASTQTTYDLERIGEPVFEHKYYVAPIDALTGRFFWGGALLLLTAGVTRIGLSSLLNLSRPPVPGLVLNVLVYFALGLVMLGQIQFAELSHRWREEGLDVSQELAGHWVRYTLLFLGLAALIAFLLPTGYTLPLLDVVSIVIGAILYTFNLIFYLALSIFFLLLTPLARLLGVQERSRPTEPPAPPVLPPATSGGPTPRWFEVVKSVLFWVVAMGFVVYVVRGYLRDRPELLEATLAFRPIRVLRRIWGALWRRLTGLVSAARERMPAQLRLRRRRGEEERAAEGGPFRFFRLGALSRRERTLYYYLSILRRAARQGYPRDRSETPYEYDTTLGPRVPQAERELDSLTEAFVETRYSQHPVDQEREERVRADWKRVRAALRALRRAREEDDP